MQEYQAPLADMRFVLRELANLESVARLPGFAELSPDLAEAVLEEAARFAGGVLSPLNHSGDLDGARWRDGAVITARGWKHAYDQFVAGGWNALSCASGIGGQNLPRAVSALVEEMWHGANMAFALCPMLTRGAVEAIELRGSQRLRQAYLPKMVAGGWQLLRSAGIAQQRLDAPQRATQTPAFYQAKIATARFYADHVLSQASGLAHAIVHGAAAALAEAAF